MHCMHGRVLATHVICPEPPCSSHGDISLGGLTITHAGIELRVMMNTLALVYNWKDVTVTMKPI